MNDSENLAHLGVEILHRMVAVGRNAAIYPQNHPSVMEPALEMCDLLSPLLARHSCLTFNIVAKSEIYIEKKLLQEGSIKHADFIRMLVERGVNSLSFKSGVTPRSIALFFSLVNRKDDPEGNKANLAREFEELGGAGIEWVRLVGLDLTGDVYQLAERKESPATVRVSYDNAIGYMESVKGDVLKNGTIDSSSLKVVVTSLMEDFLNDRDAVMGLMSIKNYDEYLFHHSVNVAVICLLLAGKLSLPDHQMRAIGMCGLLHDIGKLRTPQEIVSKPERLTEGEWAIMRRHPIEGAQMLMGCQELGELPVLAAFEHHVGYDLSGYPTLKGRQSPHLISRMVTVADVYEAITAHRSYRPARNLQHAVSVLIQGAGKQFDPLMAKLLLNIIGVFPPGSTVRLQNGEIAVVVEPNEDNPFCPKVRPVGDHRDDVHAETNLIDTAKDPSRYAIAGIAHPAK